MKKLIRLLIGLILVNFIFSGCATFKKDTTENVNFPERISIFKKDKRDSSKIKYNLKVKLSNLINNFDNALNQKDCIKASMIKDEILNEFESTNRMLEEKLMSKLCLCYLKYEGEINFFKKCVMELEEYCADTQYLIKEAQFLLKLGEEFGVPLDVNCKDKIGINISKSLDLMFYGGME